ncbi:DUF3987 domain-containing protein [Belnapia sp. T18]|uniref:DUF3987 domain-containing protein n=1 Tax=Belnapia arida TaxID=2804533 RepID=A0ABS1UCH5_9PROT|nr:DUF3987 domain-containing protein [Belnapia arida]MBL6082378.1 DUF3987 domain-containing protein [Belnapia arida]
MQIGRMIRSLFKYADPGGFVSLRGFYEDKQRVFEIVAREVSDDLEGLIDEATAMATRAARAEQPVVFAPPIAVFNSSRSAGENDLLLGLVLSVECDESPAAARAQLEYLLGPATIVVASGGEWINPATGEAEPKLHLHWRLDEPTSDPAEHKKLKRARGLATALVGGDPTSVPASHPMRWPGTWHRKGAPRLSQIILETSADLNLNEAIERLEEAVAARSNRPRAAHRAGGFNLDTGESSGEARTTAELITAILTSAEYHRPIAVLAMRSLAHGVPDADAEEWLRGMMLAVPQEIRDGTDGAAKPGRWQARFDDIPRAVRTARDKLGERPAAGAQAPVGNNEAWPEPIDFLSSSEMTGTPELKAEHVPLAIWPFVKDTAERMGVDPASVALAALVSLASVTHDDFVLQPKRFDTTWTESPRIWGAIVGDPSVLKTPIIRAATKPIDALEHEARLRHAEEVREHKAKTKAWKDNGGDPATEPEVPQQERYIVEGTTTEALSEVLRDDPQAKQSAPASKVLVRQDEMSEFLANLDRYKSGGTGGGDRGAYLRLYNGGRYTIDRIQRGTFSIPNWSATFLGGIQPEPIQRIAQNAADDGLLQRFIYVVPGPPNEGADRAPDRQASARYEALFPVLAEMRPDETRFGALAGPVTLHRDAHAHREAIDHLVREMSGLPDTSSRLRAAFGKWRGLFARLTLLFHLVDVADCQARGVEGPVLRVVAEATAARAAAYIRDIVLPHALRADALMFLTAQTGHARWVAGFILVKRLERVTARDVMRSYRALEAPEQRRELLEVMESLVTMGWLSPVATTNASKPPAAWDVNPRVHSTFAARAQQERERRAQAQQETAEAIRRRRSQAA